MNITDILYTGVFTDHDQQVEITQGDLQNVDIIRVSEDMLHILEAHQSYHIQILKADYVSKDFLLRINGNDISVRLRDEVEARIHVMGFDVSRNHVKLNLISSPMPGMVLKILVQEGDTVKEGQPVIVLEAMKMENVLTAPLDGVVSKITVIAKQNVDKNQLLVEIV